MNVMKIILVPHYHLKFLVVSFRMNLSFVTKKLPQKEAKHPRGNKKWMRMKDIAAAVGSVHNFSLSYFPFPTLFAFFNMTLENNNLSRTEIMHDCWAV